MSAQRSARIGLVLVLAGLVGLFALRVVLPIAVFGLRGPVLRRGAAFERPAAVAGRLGPGPGL